MGTYLPLARLKKAGRYRGMNEDFEESIKKKNFEEEIRIFEIITREYVENKGLEGEEAQKYIKDEMERFILRQSKHHHLA